MSRPARESRGSLVPADQVEQCTGEESTDCCKSFPVDAVPRKFVAEMLDDVS